MEWECRVRAVREKAAIEAATLARWVGISRQALHNIETGRSEPSVSIAMRIASTLSLMGVHSLYSSLGWLFAGSKHHQRPLGLLRERKNRNSEEKERDRAESEERWAKRDQWWKRGTSVAHPEVNDPDAWYDREKVGAAVEKDLKQSRKQEQAEKHKRQERMEQLLENILFYEERAEQWRERAQRNMHRYQLNIAKRDEAKRILDAMQADETSRSSR